jgi:hypothetical protein
MYTKAELGSEYSKSSPQAGVCVTVVLMRAGDGFSSYVEGVTVPSASDVTWHASIVTGN